MKPAQNKIARYVVIYLLSVAGSYTLFTLIVSLLLENRTVTYGFVRQKVWQIFLIAVAISTANMVFFIPKLHPYFKVATHFIALGATLMLALWLSGSFESGHWVVPLLLYAVLYVVIAPIALIIYFTQKKKKKTDKSYDRRFEKEKK